MVPANTRKRTRALRNVFIGLSGPEASGSCEGDAPRLAKRVGSVVGGDFRCSGFSCYSSLFERSAMLAGRRIDPAANGLGRFAKIDLKPPDPQFVYPTQDEQIMTKNWQLPRRTFLKGLGTAIALPMLE